jgi:hypothetical protein
VIDHVKVDDMFGENILYYCRIMMEGSQGQDHLCRESKPYLTSQSMISYIVISQSLSANTF